MSESYLNPRPPVKVLPSDPMWCRDCNGTGIETDIPDLFEGYSYNQCAECGGKGRRMTLVINIAGAPGSGKSTMAAGLFYELKTAGVNTEMAREYAKDVVWEGRQHMFAQQIYLLAKQLKLLRDMAGKVDVIVTDSPLLLMLHYRTQDITLDHTFDALLLQQYHSFNNYLIYVKRDRPYSPHGRGGTEEESDAIADSMVHLFLSNGAIPDVVVRGNEEGLQTAVRKVKTLLGGLDK